ncbi:hypothetical protein SAMN02927924_03354 [Sphingobium faniae]|nr:hypothetical protein SAMN02927924_03354 [Sphingobium faniae]
MTEHALDTVAIPIALEIARDRLTAIGLGRDDRQDALYQQVFANGVTIITLVGEQGLGLGDGDRHQGIDSAIIGSLATGQDEAERASLMVTAGMDLARKAAA